jgi:hypothetical protein
MTFKATYVTPGKRTTGYKHHPIRINKCGLLSLREARRLRDQLADAVYLAEREVK